MSKKAETEAKKILSTKDPYDTKQWDVLLRTVRAKEGVIDQQTRSILQAFLDVFPTAGFVLQCYLMLETAARQYGRVEALLKRYLLVCYDLATWKRYLKYVLRVVSKRYLPEKIKWIDDSFDFVLSHMHYSLDAGEVWTAYLHLAKLHLGADRIQEMFQLAVVSPILGVDAIWQDFEQVCGKEAVEPFRVRHERAKQVAAKLAELMTGLRPRLLACPPRGDNKQKASKGDEQWTIWQRVLEYEKTNPLSLSNPKQVCGRVVWTYRQALLTLRRWPEVWDELIDYCQKEGATDKELNELRDEKIKAMWTPIVLFL